MNLAKTLLLFLFFFVLSISSYAQDNEDAPEIQRTRSTPVATLEQSDLILDRYFPTLLQGEVGLLELTGDNIQEARVLFHNDAYSFIEAENNHWYAFVVADMDIQARDYSLSVIVRLDDGTTHDFSDIITVESSGFIRQTFEVPSTLGYLIDPDVERNEFARLDTLVETISPEQYWSDSAWSLPIDTGYSSRFGQYRILNEAVQTRHTGWDQSAPVGTPVGAMSSGIVVFANQLSIRGNYVLIDHGWGIYSGYAHLSQFDVQQGQQVDQGQIIGASGNTGRSNGPHLHWEIIVNSEWVDGALFLEMWLP